jgi:cyclase
MVHIVEKVAEQVFMPFTVGGGIRTTDDIRSILRAGADKVSLNSAAVRNPQLLSDGARMFGNQCIVLAVDGRRRQSGDGWNVVINGGRIDTGIDAIEWIKDGVNRGAGEILLTSMDADGTKAGYDIPFLKAVRNAVHVPVIASGGCGSLAHFVQVFEEDAADAALAASLFHYGELTVKEVKEYLKERGIPVRL